MKIECTSLMFVITAAATSLSGCGANADDSSGGPASGVDEATASNALLAEVTLPNQTVVTFEEVESGFIFVKERGQIGSTPAVTPELAKLNYVDLYTRLAGTPAPDALVAAQAREKDFKSAHAGLARPVDTNATPTQIPAIAPARPVAQSGSTGEVSQALSTGGSRSWFVSNFCPTNWKRTYNWVSVTGTGSFELSDLYEFESAAMAERGSIHYVAKYRPWYTWRNFVDETIPAGWYERVYRYNIDLDFDAKASVNQADGDLYDFCSQGH